MKKKLLGSFLIVAVLALFSTLFISSRPTVALVLLILILLISLLGIFYVNKNL